MKAEQQKQRIEELRDALRTVIKMAQPRRYEDAIRLREIKTMLANNEDDNNEG
jgi:hypothetical protein